MTSVSVIVPVKNAGPLLADVLAAARQRDDLELIVVDSGSTDGSVGIARAAGAELIEIPPGEFGHGRTRNLAAERSSGELICFLTQDAVPEPGWLDAHLESFELDPRVGAAFGPHLPFAHTSPMVARELSEFFAGFSPNGTPAVHGAGDLPFLSNVNASYRRECWEELRFPDLEYSEDQAFGRAMLEAGWLKVYHPLAAVRHAHDYGPLDFMRRYFDEYRGLREASGHVEPLAPRAAVRGVAGDIRWMRSEGLPARRRARWTARSVVHHGGRRVASALGSRSDALPSGVQRLLSLESRGGAARSAPASLPRGRSVEPRPTGFEDILRFHREGAAPLADPVPGMSERPMHVAVVIPHFVRGSGGHSTIFTLVSRLEELGHTVSIWIYDPHGYMYGSGSVIRRRIVEEFTPLRAPVHRGFDEWNGCDVALATGWDTAYATAMLDGCRARAYLIQDHEPEFFATSAESVWAAGTYELGFYGIAASRWLRDLLVSRYGQRGSWFRLGVDKGVYRPRPVERERDTVIFYARQFTPRRAVALGTLALAELHRRRPGVRFVLFGQPEELDVPFPYELLGVVSPETLAWHYSTATTGLCLSLTNYSLIPQEMMACGLPCVDLEGGSTEAELGRDAGVELAAADPVAIADALELLLDDEDHWQRRSAAGLALTEAASWDVAAKQVEAGLREALREREPAAPSLR